MASVLGESARKECDREKRFVSVEVSEVNDTREEMI